MSLWMEPGEKNSVSVEERGDGQLDLVKEMDGKESNTLSFIAMIYIQ